MRAIILFLFSFPLFSEGQTLSRVIKIDSIVAAIESDTTITREVHDSTKLIKQEDADQYDTAWFHREIFFKNGHVVKIIAWNKFKIWRTDQLIFYRNEKLIRFSMSETFKGEPGYGNLHYQVYYNTDIGFHTTWLIPKPENVLNIATESCLKMAYEYLKDAKRWFP